MKAIIIEDETAALSSLKAVLQQNSVVEIEVIAELESIEDSVEWFQCSLQPDLIFMDIHLADGLAFKIFEQVDIVAPVVFTTAYDEYALEAFRVSSIDYLLKPVTLSSLEHALNKFFLFNPAEREEHIQRTNNIQKKKPPEIPDDSQYVHKINGTDAYHSNDKPHLQTGKSHHTCKTH